MQTIADAGSVAASPGPADVFITSTFLDGEPSRFVDDYNTLVSDVEHHGLFHFDADLLTSDGASTRKPRQRSIPRPRRSWR
jgi:hypothetical protein